MRLDYYIIRGRGDGGSKFQLAKLSDQQGNRYKGQYDLARQFSSIEEMKSYLANEVVKVAEDQLELEEMNI